MSLVGRKVKNLQKNCFSVEKKQYTVEELINNPSFQRWANGTADAAEIQKWDRWVGKNEDNREKARKALALSSGFEVSEPVLPDVEQEWENVRRQLQVPTPGKKSSRRSKKRGSSQRLNWIYRVAAVLLIGFFVGWLVLPNYSPEEPGKTEQVVYETVTTGFGEKKTISLTDGSLITLAAGSKVTYRQDWLSKPVKRLELEGEAYFSIVPAKTKDHPKFVVETEDGDAAVWGTKFSVSTRDEGTQVVLEEGEVRVTVEGLSKEDENELTMVPGQLVNFQKANRDIAIRDVNTLVYTSWISDKLVFDDTPVSHLVDRIERTYDVEVEVESQELMQRKLSGSVNFKDLDSLISAVSEVLKINITRSERTVFINQTKPNRVNQ